MREYFTALQTSICSMLEKTDGKGKFGSDSWEHRSGGGGLTRVLEDGLVFEKGGVNTSAVNGEINAELAGKMKVETGSFFATGISLVIHPRSPFVPTVHANLRYFEHAGGDSWFGGGTDLSPYYPFEVDIVHFHRALKSACDAHDLQYYPRFKQWCDEYFRLPHRGEARGVGGIFFDYLRGGDDCFAFVRSVGDAFLEAYVPVVERRKSQPWGDREREWQLYRRGRYVEFNLLYDRGTAFGLATGGRTESILMSLPPLVRWSYDMQTEAGSPEAHLLELIARPREWVS